MRKFIFTFFIALLGGVSLFAQDAIVKGRIVDTNSSEVIPDVDVSIQTSIFNTATNAEGLFNIIGANLPQGEQVLLVSKSGYITQRIPVTIQNGTTINLDPILLELDLSALEAQIGIISLSDNELDEDEGTSFNVSGLLSASKDVFLRAASYDFSATFFRPRGYDSENGAVLINGVKMNKLYDGRPQWGNWGGLNDVQRNQVFSMGLSANDYTFGDLAGTTNMIMRASQYRQGGRISYATSNRSYRGRVMGSYNSGLMENGWAYSVLISRRFGDEGIREGSLYDANSFFGSVEKKINDAHSLNFTAFYTPNRRGKSSPNTQEVTDLKGVNYNSYWGEQDGEKRNSRIKEVEEPVIMLNHYWDLSENSSLNTNVAYQFGKIGNSRLGYDNVPNPDPTYYQYLPSYFLANPNGADLSGAYNAYSNVTNDGQIDWNNLYETNILYGGTSRYYLYEDRVDDKQFTVNTIYLSELNENVTLNASLNYKSLNSHNFANMIDLLGGNGYLDIDTFNTGSEAQPDLNNPDRVVGEDDIIKYNYEIDGTEVGGFAQGQFKYNMVDFYVAAEAGQTSYQRNGLFKNGSFEDNSEGESEKLNFTTFGLKGGLTYKLTGRHLLTMNTAYFTDAPTIRNTFSNSRQNNNTVVGLTEEKNTNFDASYIFRSPIVQARLTGYYTSIQDASEISFYYADGISGQGDNTTAFVQEVLTGVDKQNIGAELGIEAQVTPTIKLKAAAAYGENTYQNNPNLYLTSEDFTDELIDYGEATLENYRVSGGPQQAYQIGFEYRDPDFWWVGATSNFFSNAYVDVSPLNRTKNFYLDTDGLPFNDYDPEIARELLKQEKFDDYMLVNVVGGKSWKVNDYYVGFFATINNIFNQEYKTGGFEQGRNANYRTLSEDTANDTRVFGPKYFYGYGTTYYVNVYVRF
ncbi:carboxypeptidase-like regulatory domain-containing protein [Ulvibacter litoralis]|uniref:CarboxypepD_reg-like domain-containing protein n=1 Tax=Ulvibacter litoralis TaxID=227084 RepID=A0A1G7D0R0_9FLAO|nr:carboxypeptidase-like regulatory domain-containing protein [Ulvibacter litoralis]GHC45518.1 TonB-dependent receptor [Ulvibacter litoralis]SDE44506.1 CarboxypepD_reg-like domain-containing protein [Ulvibacter litoralis]